MVLTVRAELLLKDCMFCAAVVVVPLMCCGGSGLRDLPACVAASRATDLSRIGSDLGIFFVETSLERVGSGNPNLSRFTELLL